MDMDRIACYRAISSRDARFDPRKLLFFYYVLRGLSLIYLPYSDFSLVSPSVFAVFYGPDWLATVPPTVLAAA